MLGLYIKKNEIDGDGVPNGIDANPLSAANATELIFPLNGTRSGVRMSSGLQVQ